MKVIGLTGGIGSGKSTVARFLGEMGAVVVDLDKVGHDVLKKDGGAYRQVVDAFGKNILAANGEIDRAKLGQIVFKDPAALKRLNSITHPLIDKIVEKDAQESRKKGAKVLVFEAAAMLEAGKSWQADELWVTTAPQSAVLKRLKARSGYNAAEAKKRIDSQMANEEKIKKADVIIENSGTLKELKASVKTEWEKLLKRI